MWLNKLKIAIVEKNTDTLLKLMDDIPSLRKSKDLQEAVYLLREASELAYTLQDEASTSMAQIKKNIAFLRSSESRTSNTLDITL